MSSLTKEVLLVFVGLVLCVGLLWHATRPAPTCPGPEPCPSTEPCKPDQPSKPWPPRRP